MKFESGVEKENRERKKAEGEKLRGLDAYKDFNSELVDELLEKRKKEIQANRERQRERINALEKAEKDGKLFIK